MPNVSSSLREILEKESKDIVCDVDLIESIVNINKETKENVNKKIENYLEKHEKALSFIIECINVAFTIREKESESLYYLISPETKKFNIDLNEFSDYKPFIDIINRKNVCSYEKCNS